MLSVKRSQQMAKDRAVIRVNRKEIDAMFPKNLTDEQRDDIFLELFKDKLVSKGSAILCGAGKTYQIEIHSSQHRLLSILSENLSLKKLTELNVTLQCKKSEIYIPNPYEFGKVIRGHFTINSIETIKLDIKESNKIVNRGLKKHKLATRIEERETILGTKQKAKVIFFIESNTLKSKG